jgi:hypothetical protein
MITKEQNILTMLDNNLGEKEGILKINYLLAHIGLNTFAKRTECINWLKMLRILKENKEPSNIVMLDIDHTKIKSMLKKYGNTEEFELK